MSPRPVFLLQSVIEIRKVTKNYYRKTCFKTFLFHSVYGHQDTDWLWCALGLLVGGTIKVPQLQLQLLFPLQTLCVPSSNILPFSHKMPRNNINILSCTLFRKRKVWKVYTFWKLWKMLLTMTEWSLMYAQRWSERQQCNSKYFFSQSATQTLQRQQRPTQYTTNNLLLRHAFMI